MNLLARFFLIVMLSCPLLFMAGCGAKPLTYTPTGGSAGTDPDQGYREGQIREEMGPVQEGLDSTGGSGSYGSDQQSDAYKREHGRSSPEMRPLYFKFDRSTIEADQIQRMEHNGSYLLQNPSTQVLIEGNTDERGTNEYNLALGERRALIAKKYLVQFGVEERRIRTVSYGEERPLFLGQNEDDYAQNRRDDFILE